MNIYCRDRYFSGKLIKRCSNYFKSLIETPLADADIIFFPGGADINPGLYNEEPIPETSFAPDIDALDLKIWEKVKNDPRLKIGICRG